MTRIERLAGLLEEPLLVAGPPYVLGGQANVRYLTGLQSSNAAVLVEPDGSATLYTDFRYAARAREIEGATFAETARNLLPAIGELLSGRRIAFEEAHPLRAVPGACGNAGVDPVPSSGLVESLRAVRTRLRSRPCGAAGRSPTIFAALAEALHRTDGAPARVVGRAELSRNRRRGCVLRDCRRRRGDCVVASRRARRRTDRGGRSSRHDRRRLRPRRLLLRLHADVCRRRGGRSSHRAPCTLSRSPTRRTGSGALGCRRP